MARLDEVEMLKAMFNGDELCIEDEHLLDPSLADELAVSELRLAIRLRADHGGGCGPEAVLRLALPPGYPESARPEVRVECSAAPRDDLDSLCTSLATAAQEAEGEACVYNLCLALRDELLPSFAWAAAAVAAESPSGPSASGAVRLADGGNAAAVIRIDHMNDSAAYCKKLREWARQDGLTGALFYRVPEKSGRWEDIYLILLAVGEGDFGSFISNLRTHHVDKNSRGLKCKERKSDVLFAGPLDASSDAWPWEALDADRRLAARAEVLPEFDYGTNVAAQAALSSALARCDVDAPAGLADDGAAVGVAGGAARDCANGGGCFLSLAVKPNAKNGSQVTNASELRRSGAAAGCVRVDVAAAPRDGDANREVIALLAASLGVPRTTLSLVRGGASREKEVFVEGLAAAEALRRLANGSAP